MRNFRALFGNLIQGEWPNITAKNASGPDAQDGTPYSADILDDIWGWEQCLLAAAGMEPNGKPESNEASQIVDAIKHFFTQRDNRDYPIGKFILQYPGEKSPIDNILPGNWEKWNKRISMLGLGLTAPPASLAGDFAAQGVNIWNLNTDGTVATQGTKKYTKPTGYLVTERVKGGLALTDDDWAVGHKIVGGQYDGYYVWEPLCLAGAFPSIDDGGTFRPPFEGGVHGDQARNLTGNTSVLSEMINSGVFINGSNAYYPQGQYIGGGRIAGFDSSRVVPTGPQFSPVAFSTNVWCRTS